MADEMNIFLMISRMIELEECLSISFRFERTRASAR